MTPTRKELARQALVAALELRTSKGRNLIDPICVYDLAADLKIEVRFVDIPSLEGMYANAPRPTIILGAERPAGRRVYTCGHEVGHDRFGHGTRIDEFRLESTDTPSFEPEEFLAQAFSGFLLMPKLAVCNAFASREWKPTEATPEQIYRIANLFGVTYSALIHHMSSAIGLLPQSHAQTLLCAKLKDIRSGFISDPRRQLVLVDTFWKGRAIDLEVGDLVLTPTGINCEGRSMVHLERTARGELFEASQPGHGRFVDSDSAWASFIRVSRHFYVGRSIFRHLEEVADE